MANEKFDDSFESQLPTDGKATSKLADSVPQLLQEMGTISQQLPEKTGILPNFYLNDGSKTGPTDAKADVKIDKEGKPRIDEAMLKEPADTRSPRTSEELREALRGGLNDRSAQAIMNYILNGQDGRSILTAGTLVEPQTNHA